MNFYFNGCSHTEGAGLDFICNCCELELMRKYKHNFTGLFPSLFGDWELQSGKYAINCNEKEFFETISNPNKNHVYIESKCGKSNDRLFLECLRSLNLFEFDYVVIQWTHPSRAFYSSPHDQVLMGDTDVGSIDNWKCFGGSDKLYDDKESISFKGTRIAPDRGVTFGSRDINVHSHLSDGDVNFRNIQPKMEPQATLQTLSYMICIQNILKNKKIKYCFMNYHELDEYIINTSLLSDLVDWSKFIYMENENEKTKGIHNFFKTRKELIHDDNLHHNEEGAKFIFNKLREYFNV